MKLAPPVMNTKSWILLVSCSLLVVAFLAPMQWPAKARPAGYVFIAALGGIGILIGGRLAENVNKSRGLGDPDDD